jgi:hypothetical protein
MHSWPKADFITVRVGRFQSSTPVNQSFMVSKFEAVLQPLSVQSGVTSEPEAYTS